MVASSPLLDGSKPANELTRADKLELHKLFKEEKGQIDRAYPAIPAQPWPLGWPVN